MNRSLQLTIFIALLFVQSNLAGTCPGVCQPTTYSCAKPYVSGLCPGSSSIQCCEESTPNCPGQCQVTSLSCSGSYVSGLCPGDSTIKCCESSSGSGGGVYGVDVAVAVSQSTWSCLIGQGYVYAIVRCYRSNGQIDSNAVATIKNAWAAGIERVDVYMFPCYSCGDPAGQVTSAVNNLQNNHVNYTAFWLDIEGGTQYWSATKSNNQNFFVGLVNQAKSMHQKIGVYTSSSEWNGIMGNSYTGGSAYPLWYPHYQAPPDPSFNDFVAFAGWSSPFMKQYAGDTTACSTGVDLNWLPTANFTESF